MTNERRPCGSLWEPRRVAQAIGAGIIYQNLSERERQDLEEARKDRLLERVEEALKNPKPLDASRADAPQCAVQPPSTSSAWPVT